LESMNLYLIFSFFPSLRNPPFTMYRSLFTTFTTRPTSIYPIQRNVRQRETSKSFIEILPFYTCLHGWQKLSILLKKNHKGSKYWEQS
jgi:hypothetical protein